MNERLQCGGVGCRAVRITAKTGAEQPAPFGKRQRPEIAGGEPKRENRKSIPLAPFVYASADDADGRAWRFPGASASSPSA